MPIDASKSQNGSAADLASAANANAVRTCGSCQLSVVGQSVRALGLYYHMDCFKCKECSAPVADKFFPLYAPQDTAKTNPTLYCEKHYFALHGLLCDKCGLALRGPHINALGKKFHLDHFGCHVCTKVFRQHDSYYEREGKLWHVKANFQHGDTAINEADPDAEINRQAITLAKVDKIISVVSSFEDSSANVIGDMMSHHSSRRFAEVCLDGHKFIQYVNTLFRGLESIDQDLISVGGDETAGILATRQEPRK
ncbi:UNVERIFIED_CONTAM: hypothetical protein HDU68_005728, partial [Siphonaria sp. JEL0065]